MWASGVRQCARLKSTFPIFLKKSLPSSKGNVKNFHSLSHAHSALLTCWNERKLFSHNSISLFLVSLSRSHEKLERKKLVASRLAYIILGESEKKYFSVCDCFSYTSDCKTWSARNFYKNFSYFGFRGPKISEKR